MPCGHVNIDQNSDVSEPFRYYLSVYLPLGGCPPRFPFPPGARVHAVNMEQHVVGEIRQPFQEISAVIRPQEGAVLLEDRKNGLAPLGPPLPFQHMQSPPLEGSRQPSSVRLLRSGILVELNL